MAIHERNGRRISTEFVFPPIADRSMDWSAVEDGVYDCDCDQDGFFSTQPVGTGPTQEAAIADLLDQLEDDDSCPRSDPDCLGKNGDCHDVCEAV